MEQQKAPMDADIKSKLRNHKLLIACIFMISFIGIHYLVQKLGWNQAEPITWVLSTLPLPIVYLYMIFYEKTLNPIEYLSNKKSSITKKHYNKYNFDITKLDNLKKEAQDLEDEIQVLSD